LEFGEADKWGKRRPQLNGVEFPVNQHTDELKALAREMKRLLVEDNSRTDRMFELGFDVVGVGGGQWSYQSNGNRLVRGLPGNSDASIVRITSKSLWQILSDRKSVAKNRYPRSQVIREKLGTPGVPGKQLMSYVDADAYL
jgi:hypothetical protein